MSPTAWLHGLGALHFLRPWWLGALLLLPLLAWWWHRRQREHSAWQGLVDPHLLPRLLAPGSDRRSRAGAWLAVLGYGKFSESHKAVHDLMDRLKVPHEYRDGPQRQHDWHSGWVAGAVEFLATGGGK